MYHSSKNWLHFDAVLIPEFDYESYKKIPLQLVVLCCSLQQETASAKKKECTPLIPNSS
jgi:hypothetical protein